MLLPNSHLGLKSCPMRKMVMGICPVSQWGFLMWYIGGKVISPGIEFYITFEKQPWPVWRMRTKAFSFAIVPSLSVSLTKNP